MTRHTWVFPLLVLILSGSLLVSGCAHRTKTSISKIPPSTSPPHSTLVLEAKAESSNLRSALASERIKSAKQAADLRSLQAQAVAHREREAEQAGIISRLKSEIETIKAERDQLRAQNSDLRTKTASLPELVKIVSQIRTLETSFSGMTSSLKSLSGEISHLKQDMKKSTAAAAGTIRKSPGRTRRSVRHLDPSKTEVIIVAKGDSLWRLGRQYGISIKDLKSLNNLKNDQIIVGQRLQVPILTPQAGEDMAELPSPSKTPTP